MGRTFRRQPSQDDKQGHSGKQHKHSNGKKLGGMRIITDSLDEDEFDDGVYFRDEIIIELNKDSDE